MKTTEEIRGIINDPVDTVSGGIGEGISGGSSCAFIQGR